MSDGSSTGPVGWGRVAHLLVYVGLTVLLVLVLTGVLDWFVSPRLATRVAYNSEAYLFAVALGAWIQFGVQRTSRESRLRLGLAFGAVWALVGIGLLLSGWPSQVVTLNETAFALAVLIPYVSLRRPIPNWLLSAIPMMIALTVLAVGWSPQSWVIDQAETFGFVVLAILTFDVFDRPLLQPDATVNRWTRWTWYGFLVAEPLVVSALGTEIRTGSGATALTLEYLGRIHESFVGVLLASLVLHISIHYRSKHQLWTRTEVRRTLQNQC